MTEGQTATNPQTGERVVLRGGQWVPMGGGQSAPRQQRQVAPRRQISFQSDADAVARTLIGEAANQGEQGMLAVGGVIANRARQRGLSPAQVVLERNQFEPWGNPETTSRLLNISPQSPEYQQAYAIAQRALAGEDPTGGASHFYAPRAQAALGRAKPSWDNGTGRAIGDHLFFNLDGSPAQTPDASFTSAPMPAEQPTIQTATNPQTGEKLQLVNGQWQPMQQAMEVTIDTPGIRILGGKTQIYDAATGTYQDATPDQIAEYEANQRRSQADRQARVERQADPQYQAAMADAQRGSENVPDQLRAFTQGSTLGFLDEILGGVNYAYQGLENAGNRVAGRENRYSAAMAAQAARDSERDAQARFAAENPIQNFALQTAGGFLTPGLAAGGNYIRGGRLAATAEPLAGQVGRAAQVGAGYGALSGIGYGEGNLIERAPGAVMSGIVGAGTGALGQSAVDRLTRGAVNPAAASQARRLSREGVELTPGQMMANVPVFGPVARALEEASSTIPFAGSPVSSARQRSVETFNRAALNRVLAPLEEVGLGERIPTGVRAQIARIGNGAENPESGYQAVGRIQRVVSDAYDRALDGVEVRPDAQFYDDLGGIVNDASERMTPQLSQQLLNVLQNRAFRGLEFSDSPLTGQAFKRAESELGALAREQRVSIDPANRALAAALDDTRGALRDLVARQRPDRAPQIQAVNRAYSNLVPIEEAAGSTVAEATEGVFTPTALAQAARRSQTRRTRASGEGRFQDLTSAGKGILNSRIGDSGTATRVGVTTLASGAAGTGAVVNPGVAVPVVVGVSALYSRPAQSALNAVYRATDSRAASEAVQELARLAQRNPALVPYYEGAVQHVLGLAQRDTPAAPQAQPSTQAPSAALQRVMQ